MLISFDRLRADLFSSNLLSRSASAKKQASVYTGVGNGLSKSKDFAGEITIFILYKFYTTQKCAFFSVKIRKKYELEQAKISFKIISE